MLVLHVPNTLQDTSANGITQILSRCLWMNVSKVHRSVQALRAGHTLHSIGRKWRIGCKWRASVWARLDGWRKARRLCHKGLGCDSLAAWAAACWDFGMYAQRSLP